MLIYRPIKRPSLIKLTTILAVTGLLIVLATIGLNLLNLLETSEKNLALVIGFVAMLLGTLWKVVLEMNQEN